MTVNAFYKHSRIKQYLKDGRALRIETVINAPGDLGCQRRLHHLDEFQARARAVNARLLDTERVGQGCVLANPVFERIAHPSLTADGRRPRPYGLATLGSRPWPAPYAHLVAVTGITNRSLRALMTGLLGGAYTMNQACYDLARLRPNGLITRLPAKTLPAHQRRPAFRDLLHQGPRPLATPTAGRRPATPPQLRAALPVEHHIDERLAHSRLPSAA